MVQEDFLHFVWQYKKFAFANLTKSVGELVTVVPVGQYLKMAKPDSFTVSLVPDWLLVFLPILVPETDRGIKKFATFGVPLQHAFMSTSLLPLKQV